MVGSDLVDRVGFYAFADVASMMAVYEARMAQYGIPLATEVWPLEPTEEPRDCWRGHPSESFYWPNGEGTVVNRSGCFVNELGYANLRFVLTGPRVYVGVLGNGAAIAPLYAWAMDDPRGDDTAASGYPSIWQPPAVHRVGPAS